MTRESFTSRVASVVFQKVLDGSLFRGVGLKGLGVGSRV